MITASHRPSTWGDAWTLSWARFSFLYEETIARLRPGTQFVDTFWVGKECEKVFVFLDLHNRNRMPIVRMYGSYNRRALCDLLSPYPRGKFRAPLPVQLGDRKFFLALRRGFEIIPEGKQGGSEGSGAIYLARYVNRRLGYALLIQFLLPGEITTDHSQPHLEIFSVVAGFLDLLIGFSPYFRFLAHLHRGDIVAVSPQVRHCSLALSGMPVLACLQIIGKDPLGKEEYTYYS